MYIYISIYIIHFLYKKLNNICLVIFNTKIMSKTITLLIVLFILDCSYAKSKSELSRALGNARHDSNKNANKHKQCINDYNNYKNIAEDKYIIISPNDEYLSLDKSNKYIGTIINNFNIVSTYGNKFIIQNRTIIPNNHSIFYVDNNYNGLFISLHQGIYTTEQISLPKYSISSIKVAEGYEIKLYDNNCNKNSVNVNSDISDLSFIKFNDKTVAIEIIKK